VRANLKLSPILTENLQGNWLLGSRTAYYCCPGDDPPGYYKAGRYIETPWQGLYKSEDGSFKQRCKRKYNAYATRSLLRPAGWNFLYGFDSRTSRSLLIYPSTHTHLEYIVPALPSTVNVSLEYRSITHCFLCFSTAGSLCHNSDLVQSPQYFTDALNLNEVCA
jgi:hypothetical protein